jgi:hypothetical protein
MPRVHTKTRSNRATKRPYRCERCREEILPGQRYFQWEKRYGGPRRQHVECGYPRPTQLSNRKTAQIEEAVMDADLSQWQPSIPEEWDGSTDSIDVDVEHLRDLLSNVAETARDVGQEYQDSFDNLPENFQYGATGEALQEVAQELESWADEVEDFDPQSDEPDWPEREEDEDGNPVSSDDEWREEVQEALDKWADDVRGEAEDKISEIPEYQG